MWAITKVFSKMWFAALVVPSLRPAIMGLIALMAEELLAMSKKENQSV